MKKESIALSIFTAVILGGIGLGAWTSNLDYKQELVRRQTAEVSSVDYSVAFDAARRARYPMPGIKDNAEKLFDVAMADGRLSQAEFDGIVAERERVAKLEIKRIIEERTRLERLIEERREFEEKQQRSKIDEIVKGIK